MDIRHTITLLEQAEKMEKLKIKPLDYPQDALEPCMSKDCVRVHYDILTKKYFDKYAKTGDLFQKAGAILHNDYYWPFMQAYASKNVPTDSVMDRIDQQHSSYQKFQQKIVDTAMGIQGNGWVFITQDLQIASVQNHVIKTGIAWAIDVWEHATVDYDYNREQFFERYWNIVNWKKVESAIT